MPGAAVFSALAALSIAVSSVPVKTELRCADPIPATVLDRMDSGTAYAGERFRFKTTAAVTHGPYVIPSGTQGFGYVRYVHHAATHSRNGLLVLEPRILTVGELQIPVMWDPMETAEYAGNTTLADQAIGYIPLMGVSQVISAARMGRNVVIGPGFVFHVVVLDEGTNREPCGLTPVTTATPSPLPTQSQPPSPHPQAS